MQNQKGRLHAAVAEAVSEQGYAEMRVKDILDHAGMSRRTFYEYYGSKLDAFLDAYDEVVRQLLAHIGEAYDEHADDPVARIRECLKTFLGFAASEPTFANLCFVEVLAAGPEAIQRRNGTMQALASLIERGVEGAVPKRDRPPAMIAETLVGGIYEAVYARVLNGRERELPGLLPELMFAILLPYAGRRAAMEQLRREQRRARARKERQTGQAGLTMGGRAPD